MIWRHATPLPSIELLPFGLAKHIAIQIWANIDSANGLLPDGTKPLLKLTLAYPQGPVTLIRELFQKIIKLVWKLRI